MRWISTKRRRLVRANSLKPTPDAVMALGVFVLAFAIRVGWVWQFQSPFDAIYSDMQGYVERALALVNHTDSPYPRYNLFYPFGAHTIYAGEIAIFGWQNETAIKLIHILWGSIPPPLVALLALRIHRRRWVAALTGLLAAVWHPAVTFSGYFSSEQLYSALLILHVWLVVRSIESRKSPLAAGLITGCAYLVRPQILLTVALLFGAWLWNLLCLRTPRPGLRRTAVMVTLFLSIMTFAAVRYRSIAGEWGLISDNGTVMKLFADTTYGGVQSEIEVPGGSYGWRFSPPSKRPMGEIAVYHFTGYIADSRQLDVIRTSFLRSRSFSWKIARRLSNVTLLVANNELWPEIDHVPASGFRRSIYDLFFFLTRAVLVPLALIGAIDAAIRRRSMSVVLVAHLVTLIVAAAVYYGEIRYRVPYDPILILLGLSGLLVLVRGARAMVRAGRALRGAVARQSQ